MEFVYFFYLFVSHGFFVSCYESNTPQDTFEMDCVKIPENNYSSMVLKPNQTRCPPYNCWESQLTLSNKAKLAYEYNKFRNDFAKKLGIDSMVETLWHWSLEKEALLILQDCPDKRTAAFETRDVSGLDDSMNCEETIVEFPLQEGTQKELMDSFQKLLYRKDDPLDNFEDNGRFRRTSASHFGCAFMVTKHAPHMGCLVCVYCTTRKSISDKPPDCPNETEKNNSINFPYLCAHDPHILFSHLYGCLESVSSLESVCTETRPALWNQSNVIVGHGRTIYLIWNKHGLWYFVEDPDPKPGLHAAEEVKTCEDLGHCPPPVPAWYYVYNEAKMKKLNHSVYGLTKGQFIRYPPFNVFIQVDQNSRIEYLKAPCCIYLFILFLLAFCLALGVAYFTYKHHMMRKMK